MPKKLIKGLCMFVACAAILMLQEPAGSMGENVKEKRQTRPGDRPPFLIDRALLDLKSAYENREIETFIALFDPDYAGLLDLKADINAKFFSDRNLEILFITDSYLTEKNNVAVRLHWLKKTTDANGVLSKSNGRSLFVFKESPEGLRLYDIQGADPFR